MTEGTTDTNDVQQDAQSAVEVVGSGSVTGNFDRITGDLQRDVNAEYEEALCMHAKLNESYLGYKYTVRLPASFEATISPELLPEEIRSRYQDEKLRLGKMDTFPTWFKKIGSSLRSQIASALSKYSSNADIRFGYMIHVDRFEEVETALLAARGVTDEDRDTYQGTSVVENALDMIEQKRSRRNDWEVTQDAPVTYRDYISYMYDRYDILRIEILSEYRRMFSEDLVNVIEGFIPSRESLRNARRIKCDWTRTQEIPSCVMQGNTTYRAIADRVRAGRDLNHEVEQIKNREIDSWKSQTLETVADIHKGLRAMIAEKVSRLKDSLDKTPLTDEEIQERRDAGAKRVVDPARITQNSVNQLTSIIDDLTGELGSFDNSDTFYQAITEFRRELNMDDVDLTDENHRQRLSSDIDRIMMLSLEDNIDPNSGEFFRGII
jgi:hypothetical protein